jgi:RNA polymerase sigma-70 factor (ECF subfamily)
MDSQQEQELAHGLGAGNPDAWRSIYDAYAQPVWNLVGRLMGGASADVADVVQETFLAAARSVRSFDPARGSLWIWLCGIARRHVALHYRKQNQQRRVVEARNRLGIQPGNGMVNEGGENRRGDAGDALETAELALLVRAALTELSDEHGAILTARYLDDCSVEQLADAERCTSTAIRSRLARARQAFRERFTRLSGGSADDRVGGNP